MSYGREMPNSEVERISKGSQLYTEFVGIIDNDLQNTQEMLTDVIDEFTSYWHLLFRHICYEYELYKYCDYEISTLKIDFKKDDGNN
jgi:hypothetical protein